MKILIPCLAIMLLCSCASSEKPSQPEKVVLGHFSPQHDKIALTVAANFASAFETALLHGTFPPFQKKLPPSARLNANDFAKLRTALIQLYGTPVKMEYITFLNQGKLRDYLWRIKFVSSSKDNKTDNPKEILFCVRIYCEKDKTPAVAGFSFKRF